MSSVHDRGRLSVGARIGRCGRGAGPRRIKGELATQAAEHEETGAWLAEAMQATWDGPAKALLQIAPLSDLLAERHRIITANWQNAGRNTIVAALLRRANEILDRIDFTPAALRSDLADQRLAPRYLYGAAELIDHAADLLAEGAVLVHESERRWRVFSERVEALRAAGRERAGGLHVTVENPPAAS